MLPVSAFPIRNVRIQQRLSLDPQLGRRLDQVEHNQPFDIAGLVERLAQPVRNKPQVTRRPFQCLLHRPILHFRFLFLANTIPTGVYSNRSLAKRTKEARRPARNLRSFRLDGKRKGIVVIDEIAPEKSILPKLSIRIDRQDPMDLDQLANMMHGISSEYRLFLAENPAEDATAKHAPLDRLVVVQVRQGSLIFDLLSQCMTLHSTTPAALPSIACVMMAYKRFSKFTENFSKIANFLAKVGELPSNISKLARHLDNFEKIMDPIASKPGSSITFKVDMGDNAQVNIGTMNVTNSFNSGDAQTIEQTIGEKRIELARKPTIEREKVELRWYQARNDAVGKVGNMAVVESIYPRPVRAVFASDIPRNQMLRQSGTNPFTQVFNVDLTVTKGKDKPVAYTIHHVYEHHELKS